MTMLRMKLEYDCGPERARGLAAELAYRLTDDEPAPLMVVNVDDEPTGPMRYALVTVDVGKVEQLKAYMPGNYEVVGRTPIGGSNTVSVLIAGRDRAGWTLHEYVIPRLASGMYWAEEIA